MSETTTETTTEVTLIDAPTALSLLERAVAEKGEGYVYPDDRGPEPDYDEDPQAWEAWDVRETDYRDGGNCRYVVRSTGAPACIAGYVLSYAGQLDRVVEGAGVWSLALYAEPGAVDILASAQAAQDEGHPWGEALRGARRRARNLA